MQEYLSSRQIYFTSFGGRRMFAGEIFLLSLKARLFSLIFAQKQCMKKRRRPKRTLHSSLGSLFPEAAGRNDRTACECKRLPGARANKKSLQMNRSELALLILSFRSFCATSYV
jgi:hypothetical protein